MTSEEPQGEVASIIEECQERVLGVGAQQYATQEGQLFEQMPYDALFEYAEEEIRDLVVYACMLRIRLRRLRDMLYPLLHASFDGAGEQAPP